MTKAEVGYRFFEEREGRRNATSLPARLRARKERRRLAALPRRTSAVTTLLGFPLRLVDAASFLGQYNQYFRTRSYIVEFGVEEPRIIDCGANIGISVLFWKSLAPNASIAAFEADPEIAPVLRANLHAAGHDDVEVIPAAAWTDAGAVPFTPDGADSGRVGAGRAVAAVRLRDYLSDPVALLKLDVEGAEVPLLLDCEDRLGNVDRLVFEYHSFSGEPQHLADVLRILEQRGFRVIIESEYVMESPLVDRRPEEPMDNRLVVYAVRPRS